MYHDLPPPPIPIKLKPKTLKKLSQQARGPVYVFLPSHPPGPVQAGSMPHHHHHQPRAYHNSNFTLVNAPRPVAMMQQPSCSASQAGGSISESGSIASALLDHHQRFRPDKPGASRPRVHQLQWMQRNGRSMGNWIHHIGGDDEDEADEPASLPTRRPASSSTFHQQPGGRPMSSEIQLSSRVASMTIADVSPRFALKVSPSRKCSNSDGGANF